MLIEVSPNKSVMGQSAADYAAYYAAREIQAQILAWCMGLDWKFQDNWRSASVVALARNIYDTKKWYDCCILADALQDEGCEAEFLTYLRDDTQIKFRGCWVLDQILGLQ